MISQMHDRVCWQEIVNAKETWSLYRASSYDEDAECSLTAHVFLLLSLIVLFLFTQALFGAFNFDPWCQIYLNNLVSF